MQRLTALSLGSVIWAFAMFQVTSPPAASIEGITTMNASRATLSLSEVGDDDGNEAKARILGIEPESTDQLELLIRVCQSSGCSDFEEVLDESEYEFYDLHQTYVSGDVAQLGSIELSVFTHTADVIIRECHSSSMRTETMMIGDHVTAAGASFGGRLGPWTIVGGWCGMNAENVQVVDIAG